MKYLMIGTFLILATLTTALSQEVSENKCETKPLNALDKDFIFFAEESVTTKLYTHQMEDRLKPELSNTSYTEYRNNLDALLGFSREIFTTVCTDGSCNMQEFALNFNKYGEFEKLIPRDMTVQGKKPGTHRKLTKSEIRKMNRFFKKEKACSNFMYILRTKGKDPSKDLSKKKNLSKVDAYSGATGQIFPRFEFTSVKLPVKGALYTLKTVCQYISHTESEIRRKSLNRPASKKEIRQNSRNQGQRSSYGVRSKRHQEITLQ